MKRIYFQKDILPIFKYALGAIGGPLLIAAGILLTILAIIINVSLIWLIYEPLAELGKTSQSLVQLGLVLSTAGVGALIISPFVLIASPFFALYNYFRPPCIEARASVVNNSTRATVNALKQNQTDETRALIAAEVQQEVPVLPTPQVKSFDANAAMFSERVSFGVR